MSNSLAIAAVTATLRSLLARGVDILNVTTKPLDKARTDLTEQINIFLYQTTLNGSLRNMPTPHQVKPGETGQPPLALNLFYLITAYGDGDDDASGHQLLGRAMSTLHDHPLLGAAEILDATDTEIPGSDLHLQAERVRITPQPMPLDEMSKLWTTFQTQFRISAAYQISVVLIESTRTATTPLPVLARGSQSDKGIQSQANLIPPFPTLNSLELPDNQFSALLNDNVILRGFNLDGTNVVVHLENLNSLLNVEREITILNTQTANEVSFNIPNDPTNLPAGFYTLAVEVTRPGETFSRMTNLLVFSLAPEITSFPITVIRAANGDVTLTLDCIPEVRPEQRAALLLGDREILSEPHPAPPPQTGTLTFEFGNPTFAEAPDPVEHFVRLRVDGVDSVLIDRTGDVPVFRNNQKVRIE
jgi:hypothetical protein